MDTPGSAAKYQAVRSISRASPIMLPHDTALGSPMFMKDSADSIRMALATSTDVVTITGGSAFGRISRSAMRAWLKPRLRAACTNSDSRRVRNSARTSRAKGLTPRAVALRHVLRNALIPVTTVAGLNVGTLLGGAVVVETVFSWPGLGRLAYESVMARDYVVLLGILVLSSLLVIVANIVVDLLQTLLEPRIRVR